MLILLLLLNKTFVTFFLKNLKLKRTADYKENEIQQLQDHLNKQDEHITDLEKDLLKFYQDGRNVLPTETRSAPEIVQKPTEITSKLKLYISKQTQTLDILHNEPKTEGHLQETINKLQLNVLEKESTISEQSNQMTHLKNKIAELEANVRLFKQQIADRQSQIMFYENHILELRGKIEKSENASVDTSNDPIDERNEETLMLKVLIKLLNCFVNVADFMFISRQQLTTYRKYSKTKTKQY